MIKFCKKCDIETVRTSNGRCKPCAREHDNKWRKANIDKILAKNKKWREENKDKDREYAAKYRSANKEKAREYAAKYYANNLDMWRESGSKRRANNKDKIREYNAKYFALNKDRLRDLSAKYRAANPEACRIHVQNRRARKIGDGGKLSPNLTDRLFKMQRGKCACGCKQPLGGDYHRDHIMPLALGGSNTDNNIQLLRATCNRKKSSKHPAEFMRQRGFLI